MKETSRDREGRNKKRKRGESELMRSWREGKERESKREKEKEREWVVHFLTNLL